MDIIQSFLFSVSRVSLSLYEQRIIVKVVEHAQKVIEGRNMSANLKKLPHDFDNVKISLPARYVLDENNDHYDHVYNAARSLMSRTFEYYDLDTKIWHASPLIYNVHVRSRSGVVEFYVARCLFDVILDFRKGFRRYDINTALNLGSPAAIRLYIILSGQQTPIEFKIDYLKKLFGVEDKYRQTADFIKRVIEPARILLNNEGCCSFAFHRIRENDRKGSKVVALRFIPVFKNKQQANITSDEEALAYLYVRQFLTRNECIPFKSIVAHDGLIKMFSRITGAEDLIYHISQKSHRADNKIGYIINAMKNECKKFYGEKYG